MKVKNKKCIICGKNFKPYKSTERVCSYSCAIDFAKKKSDDEKKSWPQRKKKMKEAIKTRTQKINDVRPVFQRYIRARDKDKPCISCGTTTATKWDAGHYLKAELYTGLIFDEKNVHKQCQQCNQYGGGMQAEYRMGLIGRIGEAKVKALEKKALALKVYRWSDKELQDLKKKYKEKIRLFEK